MCALAVATIAPAHAAGAHLTSTAYGALDFGDRILYHLDAADCGEYSAHITVDAAGTDINGPESSPLTDVIDPSACAGVAQVPSFNETRAAGWRQGDPISFSLVASNGETVPLRYARIEADAATSAAGGWPAIVAAQDPDTGSWDKAVSMAQGDAINIGRVDLNHVEAFSLRICLSIAAQQSTIDQVLEERWEIRTMMSIRQGSPTGPPIVQPIDVASDPFTDDRLNTHGFGHGCWHLVNVPVTGTQLGVAPELFIVYETGVEPVTLNSIDIDGTGAKVAALPQQDPPNMETIFDGTSFDGWTQTNCELDSGAARSADASIPLSGCAMTFNKRTHNVIMRADIRRQSFYDNSAMMFSNEIQGRSAGEYGPGGYFGEYAARWEKFNAWPDWSQIEIVQLGARYVVTLNGRTVSDHVASKGDPAPFQIQLQNQPEWSWQYSVQGGFGDMDPTAKPLTSWGRFWWRNIRLYECTSATDPVCTAAADARAGQVPKA